MYCGTPAGTGQGPRTVTRYTIGFGDYGSLDTLAGMARVVRESQVDPLVLETAADIVRSVSGRNKAGQIAAVRQWLKRKVQFLADPADHELLRTPHYMLNRIRSVGRIQADCDDAAILAAALLGAIGIRTRFVAAGFQAVPGPLLHVWTDGLGENGWQELDVTRPEGVPLAAISRTVIYEV
jgi:hypothetical protein